MVFLTSTATNQAVGCKAWVVIRLPGNHVPDASMSLTIGAVSPTISWRERQRAVEGSAFGAGMWDVVARANGRLKCETTIGCGPHNVHALVQHKHQSRV